VPSMRQKNEYAVADELRVLSSYNTAAGNRIWLLTEADRSTATFLLSEEYLHTHREGEDHELNKPTTRAQLGHPAPATGKSLLYAATSLLGRPCRTQPGTSAASQRRTGAVATWP